MRNYCILKIFGPKVYLGPKDRHTEFWAVFKNYRTWAADYTWSSLILGLRKKKHGDFGGGLGPVRAATITPMDYLCKLGMIHVPDTTPRPTPRRLGVRSSAGSSDFVNSCLAEGMKVGVSSHPGIAESQSILKISSNSTSAIPVLLGFPVTIPHGPRDIANFNRL